MDRFLRGLRNIIGPVVVTSGLVAGNSGDVSFSLIFNRTAYTTDDTVVAAVVVSIPPEYHLYGNPLGPGIGKPLQVGVFSAPSLNWTGLLATPAEKFKPDFGEWVWAYEKKAVFFLEGIVPDTLTGTTDSIHGIVSFDGLICHKDCRPFFRTLSYTLPLGTGHRDTSFYLNDMIVPNRARARPMPFLKHTAAPDQSLSADVISLDFDSGFLQTAAPDNGETWNYTPREGGGSSGGWSFLAGNFLGAIVLAFLAGIILNVMPCVLPVLGIKIMSLSGSGHLPRREAFMKSLFFAFGMMSLFMVLATLAAFARFSWGEQFQKPAMLVGIVAVIFVFALGMFDVYTILLPANIGSLERKSEGGRGADFLKGALTTIMATPCSGPFLGATLAWTLTQPPAIIYAIFASIGAGMAFPYIVLSSSSKLVRLIPKPGKWMGDFRYVMGFVLLGFAAYLTIGLSSAMTTATVLFCVVLAFSVYLLSRIAPFGSGTARRLTGWISAIAVAFVGGYLCFHGLAEGKETGWETFRPELLREAHSAKQHALIDFTADWCMNCQFNKAAVLNNPEVQKLFKKKNVRLFRADFTRENPVAESLRNHLGSRSVPFCTIFPGNDPQHPIILRDILHKPTVMDILRNLPDNP